MRSAFKLANRLDSLYSMLLTLPVVFVIANSAIQFQNGELSKADFSAQTLQNASQAIQRATSNYTPVVETTGKTMASGITKLTNAATGCLSGSRVIHLSGTSAGGCGTSKLPSIGGSFNRGSKPIYLR